MFEVTILIPTRQRAGYLLNCLQSIVGQSRKDFIREIVVSENSADIESENVVGSFADELPLRFRRQNPERSAYQHFLELVKNIKTDYVALLGDDDMWGTYHLEEAARAFEFRPAIKTFFGQTVNVNNETCYPLSSMGNSLMNVPSASDSGLHDFMLWSARETAIYCMSHTPLNIWALVSETSVLQSAMHTVFTDPRYASVELAPSADKKLIWALSNLGDIAISRNISLFYRRHSGTESAKLIDDKKLSHLMDLDYDLTMDIAEEAALLGIDAPQEWRNIYTAAKSEHGLADYCSQIWNTRLRDLLIPPPMLMPEVQTKRSFVMLLRRWLGSGLYLVTPPLLPWIARKFMIKTSI
jgi:glycosyltransferase involved in cell wall biosynthesis